MSPTNNVWHIFRGCVDENNLITINEEVKPGKGFVILENNFFIYDEIIKKAILLPGAYLPDFEEVGEKSLISGDNIVVRMITDSRGKPLEILWVYSCEYGKMISKMLLMPLYKIIQSSSGYEWIGRNIKAARERLTTVIFARFFISYGIKTGNTRIYESNGKNWKQLPPNEALSLLELSS